MVASKLPSAIFPAGHEPTPLGKETGDTMKKFVLSVALTTAFATSAFAADLAVKSRPMAPAPIPYAASWTGCYVGAGGGYGMFNQEVNSNFRGATLSDPRDIS